VSEGGRGRGRGEPKIIVYKHVEGG